MNPAERKLAEMSRADLLAEAEKLRLKLQAMDYRGCYWDANIVQKLAAAPEAATPSAVGGVEGFVSIPRSIAETIDQAFLPINPNKMRSAAPHVVEAAKAFRAALASGETSPEKGGQ